MEIQRRMTVREHLNRKYRPHQYSRKPMVISRSVIPPPPPTVVQISAQNIHSSYQNQKPLPSDTFANLTAPITTTSEAYVQPSHSQQTRNSKQNDNYHYHNGTNRDLDTPDSIETVRYEEDSDSQDDEITKHFLENAASGTSENIYQNLKSHEQDTLLQNSVTKSFPSGLNNPSHSNHSSNRTLLNSSPVVKQATCKFPLPSQDIQIPGTSQDKTNPMHPQYSTKRDTPSTANLKQMTSSKSKLYSTKTISAFHKPLCSTKNSRWQNKSTKNSTLNKIALSKYMQFHENTCEITWAVPDLCTTADTQVNINLQILETWFPNFRLYPMIKFLGKIEGEIDNFEFQRDGRTYPTVLILRTLNVANVKQRFCQYLTNLYCTF